MGTTTEADALPGIGDYFDTVGPHDDLEKRLTPEVLARLGNLQRLKAHHVLANNT